MTRVVLLTTLLATSAALLLLATGVVSPAADEAPSTLPFHENQRVVVRQSGSSIDGQHGEITDPDIASGRDAMVLLDGTDSDRRVAASRLRPEANVVRFQRTATAHYGAVLDPAREGPRNALWLAQGMHADAIEPFRAANPDILAGLYKESIYTDAGSREPATGPDNTGGVSYSEADTAHPDWFLEDAAGARITHTGYSGYTLMDIGNPGYQAAWANNVVAEAKRDGWDLIFADDLGLALYSTSATPVKYPDATAWQAAVRSFLQGVYPKLHAAGIRLVANMVSGVTWPEVRREMLQWVDGTMEEGWMRPSVERWASLATAAWPKQLTEAQDSEAAQKLFLAEVPAASTDVRAIRYGLASLLLAAGGSSSFGVSGSPSHTTEQWFPEFDTARSLGSPATGIVTLPNLVRQRDFTAGTVLVNPTASTQSVSLDGPYSGSGLSHVSAVTMAPTTGLVLLRDG
jgi:hypothetical protein